MAGIVIVFDFDKTIIDCDSDNWVIDDLGCTKLFDELLQTMPWNSAMVCIHITTSILLTFILSLLIMFQYFFRIR